MDVSHGEIYWADLAPRSGSEQAGRRPVIVVSNDGFNQAPGWRSVIVVPLTTSKTQERRGPSAILLTAHMTGLNRDSVAICHQITTLDRQKLTKRAGIVPPRAMVSIEEGIRAALDLA
jgi:mRNA interferase MazF